MSRARLTLESDPALVSLQDGGRQGAMRFGVSQSGPMDWVRHAQALNLAGGERAAFEVGLAGASFRAAGTVELAVTGPGFRLSLIEENAALEPPVRLTLTDATMTLSPGRAGMWAYVAVRGIELGEPLLGSYATNARTGLGARDLARPFPCAEAVAAPPAPFEDPLRDAADVPLALLPGPQHHLFDAAMLERLTSTEYRLTNALDRMGYKLEGEPLQASTHDIISDGIVEGAIQVPGNGQPIVLCADRQPTGGYPKIAVVAKASRPRLVQRRAGAKVRFSWSNPADVLKERRALLEAIAMPVARVRRELDAAALTKANLISGIWTPQGEAN